MSKHHNYHGPSSAPPRSYWIDAREAVDVALSSPYGCAEERVDSPIRYLRARAVLADRDHVAVRDEFRLDDV